MLRSALLFALGALSFHQLPALPPWHGLAGGAALVVLLITARTLRPLAVLLVGFFWSHGYALVTAPDHLPDDQGVLRGVIEARVISLVSTSGPSSRFLVEAERVELEDGPLQGNWRLRLSWRDAPPLVPGEAWRLPVRLRAAHGYATPGAWDYEGWLYWQGVRYAGYVEPGGAAERLAGATGCCRLNRWRALIAASIDELPATAFARGVLRALVIGENSALPPEARALFQATGTSHLMAISGLHIGLTAALGLVGMSWLWRRIPWLCRHLPAPLAGAAVGLVLALCYAALAGLGLPTQRALLMLSTFALSLLLRREAGPLNALALAAVGVLLWHPPSIVAAGFWLSFGAVLAILATLNWTVGRPRWLQAGAIQLTLTVVLWPVLSLFGLPASSVAPLANLLLVPLFGLLIVPLALSGTALLVIAPAVGRPLLSSLGVLLDLVHEALAALTRLPWPDLAVTGGGVAVYLAAAVAAALLLAPPGFPLRRLAPVLFCIPWLPRAPEPGPQSFMLHILDVGQGLSVVVETRHHTLVFDTGPEFPSGFSTADAVLVPFLARRGRSRIDRLVVSHGDMDHSGGVGQVLRQFAVSELLSGEPDRVGFAAARCVAGEHWEWDGVRFEFLHPPAVQRPRGNDASCVLQIENRAGRALLTGDIEEPVERRLVLTDAPRLRTDVVVAPHHGSRSSSSSPFVAATRPRYVVYTAGWANRYGFPAETVDRRWRDSGAIPLNTATLGAIRFEFAADGRIGGPYAHRREARRFWWHDSGSATPPHAVSSADRSGSP